MQLQPKWTDEQLIGALLDVVGDRVRVWIDEHYYCGCINVHHRDSGSPYILQLVSREDGTPAHSDPYLHPSTLLDRPDWIVECRINSGGIGEDNNPRWSDIQWRIKRHYNKGLVVVEPNHWRGLTDPLITYHPTK